jgi:hypothetical protein
MPFTFTALPNNLYFIRWEGGKATRTDGQQYILMFESLLAKATSPIYFITDLRQGHIGDIDILRRLSKLSSHPFWGGGTAFGNAPESEVFASFFARMVERQRRDDDVWPRPEQALAYLEALKPGITQGIDWAALIEGYPTAHRS